MGKSLHEQLLRAGLVNQDQVRKAKKQKHTQNKQAKGPTDTQEKSAQQAQCDQVAKDRALNLQQQRRQEQKAVTAQIRQLIQAHEQSRAEGDIGYHFVDTPHVKKIYVTKAQQNRLINGQLVLVKQAQQYAIVPKEVAEKIRQRDARSVLDAPKTTPVANEYAEYAIPDDLMW